MLQPATPKEKRLAAEGLGAAPFASFRRHAQVSHRAFAGGEADGELALLATDGVMIQLGRIVADGDLSVLAVEDHPDLHPFAIDVPGGGHAFAGNDLGLVGLG